jgi:hypothetical protein
MVSAGLLLKKLLIQDGNRVVVLNAPTEIKTLLAQVVADCEWTESPNGRYDVVLLFAANEAEWDRRIQTALDAADTNGVFWVAYPKVLTHCGSELCRDRLWDLMKPFGQRPVSQIAVDDAWSALRFRPQDGAGK